MRRGLRSIIAILSVLLVFSSSTTHVSHYSPNDISFGVKIGILPTGGLTQYVIFYKKNGKHSHAHGISLAELIKIGTGKWPIPKTNIFHNFFDEEGLNDKQSKQYIDSLPDFRNAFDSLWKIRFPEHPFDGQKGKGWSQGDYRPSLKQQEFIYYNYGARGYDQDYFKDSSFYKLIRDVLDEEWISYYKSLR